MPLPNLIIAGSQKCGTTWLHQSLSKSSAIFGSTPKELGYFNRPDHSSPEALAAYVAHFPETAGAKYYMESTPHYFRTPKRRVDIASNISAMLENPRIIVIFRDPVDRYASAFIHHIMRGRFEYSPTITEVSDAHGMLTLGRYASNLRHWLPYFPDIKVLFHDDLLSDPAALIADVMAFLGLENDIDDEALMFRTNDKSVKVRRKGLNWEAMPELSPDAAAQLRDFYRSDILDLQSLTGRDLSHWL